MRDTRPSFGALAMITSPARMLMRSERPTCAEGQRSDRHTCAKKPRGNVSDHAALAKKIIMGAESSIYLRDFIVKAIKRRDSASDTHERKRAFDACMTSNDTPAAKTTSG